MKTIIIDKFNGGRYNSETTDSLTGTLYNVKNVDVDEVTGYIKPGFKREFQYNIGGLAPDEIINFTTANGNVETIIIADDRVLRKINNPVTQFVPIYVFSKYVRQVNDVLYLPNSVRISVTFNDNSTDVFYCGYINNNFVFQKNEYSDGGFGNLTKAINSISVYLNSGEKLVGLNAFYHILITAVDSFGIENFVGAYYYSINQLEQTPSPEEAPLRVNLRKIQLTVENSTIKKIRFYIDRTDAGDVYNYGDNILELNYDDWLFNVKYDIVREFVVDNSGNTVNFHFVFDPTNKDYDTFGGEDEIDTDRTPEISVYGNYNSTCYFVFKPHKVNNTDKVVPNKAKKPDTNVYYRVWKTATYHKGRVFVSDGSNKIYFSEIEDGIEKWDKIPEGNFIFVNLTEGEKIVKLISKDDAIYIVRTGGIDAIITGDSIYESVYRNIYRIGIDDNTKSVVLTQKGLVFSYGSAIYLWNFTDEPTILNWQNYNEGVKVEKIYYNEKKNEIYYTTHSGMYLKRIILRYFVTIGGRIAFPEFTYIFPAELIPRLHYVFGGELYCVFFDALNTYEYYASKLIPNDKFENAEIVTHNLLPQSSFFRIRRVLVEFSNPVVCVIYAVYDRTVRAIPFAGTTAIINLPYIPTRKFKIALNFNSEGYSELRQISYDVEPVEYFGSSRVLNKVMVDLPYIPIGGYTSFSEEQQFTYFINSTTNHLYTEISAEIPKSNIKVYLNGILLSEGSSADYTLTVSGTIYRINFNYYLYPGDIVAVDTEF